MLPSQTGSPTGSSYNRVSFFGPALYKGLTRCLQYFVLVFITRSYGILSTCSKVSGKLGGFLCQGFNAGTVAIRVYIPVGHFMKLFCRNAEVGRLRIQ